jgi:hypothetical protein
MAVTPPLSSRAVRRAASDAQQAVQSLGAVVNGNAELLNQFSQRLTWLEKERKAQTDSPALGYRSTFWQRLRWLVRGT